MGSLRFTFPRIKAQVPHHLYRNAWSVLSNTKESIPPPEEFLKGATEAYKYFVNETAAASTISHLQPMCSPLLFEVMVEERGTDESEFNCLRQEHGHLAAMDFDHVEAYITSFGPPGSHEPEDREIIGLGEHDELVTAGVLFLSEGKLGFEKSSDAVPAFREDWLLFAAAYGEDGVGNFKIAMVA